MIEFRNLSKNYGEVQALKDLNLSIPDGCIFGLIGHNGAGKSTTIKSLVSVINPTSGSIYVDGKNLEENRLEIKQKIGYVQDSPEIFLQLTANEYWEFIANIYGVKADVFQENLHQLMTLFDMTNERYGVIGEFSHGMRQKTFVIGALLHDPEIWIMDEPLTGLDPQASFDLKNLMRKHVEQNKTLLFSTHVLEVAQQFCDQIAILKKGELIYTGTMEALLDTAPGLSLETIYLNMVGEDQVSKV